MSIEKRLKDDAARFAKMQPPANLRARLQASLDAVPPINLPAPRSKPRWRWFAPAVAMLTIAMALVFVSSLPPSTEALLGQPEIFTDDGAEADVRSADAAVDSVDLVKENTESVETEPKRDLPLGRIGIFAGLALITGFLCVTELKGNPRLLFPALAALTLFVAVGLIYIFGV